MKNHDNRTHLHTDTKARFAFAFALSCLLSAIVGTILFIPAVHDDIYAAFGRVNLVIYAVLCAVAVLSFLFFYRVALRNFAPVQHPCKSRAEQWLFTSLPLIANGILLIVMFRNEPVAYDVWLPRYADAFVWHKLPLPLFLLLELALFAILLIGIRGSDDILCVPDKADGVAYWIAAALMSALVGYSMYCPNPFLNLYHVNAYYQPVLYVLEGVPYDAVHNSIYGHYGLFLAPVLRLLHVAGLGSYMRCFTLVIAGIALLQQLLVSYTLFATVKNRFLRLVGLLGSGLTLLVLRDTTYQQLYPHRTFPLILMAAAMAFNMQFSRCRGRRLARAAGWLAALFCLLWSTEMGLFALAGWCCYLGISALQACDKRWFLRCLFILLGAAIVFFSAWGVMNLYNLSAGGAALTLPQFVFPLMVRYYMTDRLELTLVGAVSTWVVILGLLLYFVCRGLYHSRICRSNAQHAPKEAFLFAMGVLLTGGYSYAINRSVYGHYGIGYELIVILLCMLAAELLPAVKRMLSRDTDANLSHGHALLAGAGMTILAVVSSLALWCVACTGSRIAYRQALSNPTVTTELWYAAKDVVKPGSKAFGFGAVEMFALFDWDNDVYNMNYMDIEIDGPAPKLYADKLLGSAVHDPVVISRECLAMHAEWDLGGYDRFMETHTQVAAFGGDETDPAFPVTLYYFEPIAP